MKKNWNGELLPGLEELHPQDAREIVGGETLWYWIGYGVGLLGHMITHPTPTQSSGQQLMNIALG